MVASEVRTKFGQLVHVPSPTAGFALGRVVDVGAERLTVRLEPPSRGEVAVAYADVLPAMEDQKKEVDDNCGLMFLNEGTLLHNCRLRYEKKKIYTYTANILLSINPYEQIPALYSNEAIRDYRGRSLGTRPPHIFAIADKAYREMRRAGESQSIVVSGESGAGKTEGQKAILHYLCENFSDKSKPIERRILETNPILEAFGNAKTLRNNNSSRFGKFVEVHFDAKGAVVGAHVLHYLLEKSRVCGQQAGERNFHVFFQLFCDPQLRSSLGLQSPADFNYLQRGCTDFFGKEKRMIRDALVDDAADFQRLQRALLDVGLKKEEVADLFRTLGGILHLGNVSFEDSDNSRGGCVIKESSRPALAKAAELLGLGENELRTDLSTRIMQPTKSQGAAGTIIQVQLKAGEAAAARDALSKAIYSRLFDSVVAAINRSIPFSESTHFIGVLDIAGFEFFKSNSYEQLLINYTNEKLQKFFNDRILKQEQELYAQEGLNVPRIEYVDNQDCIDLFEQKGSGLLELLDEEACLPRPSPIHYTEAVHQAHRKSTRLIPLRNSKEHRNRRENECFIVQHYAAAVCYETKGFLEKNSDQLHESLSFLMEASKNSFVHKLFFTPTSRSSNGALQPLKRKKLVQMTAACKFRQQLSSLIDKLEKTGTSFVRCIKPNQEMKPAVFDAPLILDQLKCAGMGEVLRLLQKGFPSRTPFSDLYNSYSKLLPDRLARLDPRLFCRSLFYALGLKEADFQFGLTRVFFRSGKFAEFDQLLKQDPASLKQLVEKVQHWVYRVRWRKAQYGAWSVIKLKKKIEYLHANATIIQAAYRGHRQRLKTRALLKQQQERRERERRERERKAAALLAEQRELERRRAEAAEIERKAAALRLQAEESSPVGRDVRQPPAASSTRPQMVDQATQSTAPEESSFALWTFNALRDLINTATDLEILRACRAEFSRRIESYRTWMQTNPSNERSEL